jgi:hypothetical protein
MDGSMSIKFYENTLRHYLLNYNKSMFTVQHNEINHTYSVEHSIGLFKLRPTCMLQVSALS